MRVGRWFLKYNKEKAKRQGGVWGIGGGHSFLFSVAVKWRSNCGWAAGEQIAFLKLQVFLPFMRPKDATHSLFVQHKQTDCKLADNFCTDNVIYSCQPFVCLVCFIQIWTKWTSLPALSSALKSHPFPSKLSYLKFIGGQSVGWMLCCFHGGKKSSVDFQGLGSFRFTALKCTFLSAGFFWLHRGRKFKFKYNFTSELGSSALQNVIILVCSCITPALGLFFAGLVFGMCHLWDTYWHLSCGPLGHYSSSAGR